MQQPTIAIATTVRDPGHSFVTWIAFHRQVAHKIYVYLDEPGPRDAALIPDLPEVRCFSGSQQSTMSGGNGVMERQIANVERAYRQCLEDGIDWLIHIDGDELLWSPEAALSDFFAGLAPEVTTVSFVNHEVINVSHADDNFKELHFFKRNDGEAVYRNNLSYRHYPFFAFYGNGKSAVRVSDYKRPDGVHLFEVREGKRHIEREVCVLHYACATYAEWLKKYAQLDAFQPYWWDDPCNPIRFPYHLDSRDSYLASKRTGDWNIAYDFYHRHLFTAAELDQLRAVGVVFEVNLTLDRCDAGKSLLNAPLSATITATSALSS